MNRDTRKSSRDALVAAALVAVVGVLLDLSAEDQLALTSAVGVLYGFGMRLYRKVRTWRGIAP